MMEITKFEAEMLNKVLTEGMPSSGLVRERLAELSNRLEEFAEAV